MILWTLFGLILVAGLFPKTPIGRLFRTALFGDPDRIDAKLQLARIAQAGLFVLVLLVLTPTMPAEIALFFAGDLALYFEIIAAVTLAGVVGWVRELAATIASLASWVAKRVAGVARWLGGRSTRQRRITRRRAKPPQNDDSEPGWGCSFA